MLEFIRVVIGARLCLHLVILRALACSVQPECGYAMLLINMNFADSILIKQIRPSLESTRFQSEARSN